MLRSFSQLEARMSGLDSRIAMVSPEKSITWTYSDFLRNVIHVSSVMNETLKDYPVSMPVAICMLNGLDFMACFFGLARTGRAVMPLNPSLTSDVYKNMMKDGKVCAVIVNQNSCVQILEAAATAETRALNVTFTPGGDIAFPWDSGSEFKDSASATGEDTVSLLLQTSGTTGKPKWVPLTQRNLMASAEHISDTYKLTQDDISLLLMPLFHVHGFIGAAISTLFSGGQLIIPPKFSAGKFQEWVRTYNPSWYSAVPTIHQILLLSPENSAAKSGSRFRFIRSCSSPLAPAVMAKLEEFFNAPVLEAYGMTEAAHQMGSNPLPPAMRIPGSVGIAAGPEIAILDDSGNILAPGNPGEISIRGENVMAGYLDNPEANRKSFSNGWFRTGDMGQLDENGYLTLLARLKEMINRAGEKIAPAQVDAAILELPGVSQAITFAVPDTLYGEAVNAVVISTTEITEEKVLEHCRAKLPAFMVPVRIHFRDSIPTGATGKVSRVQLAKLLGLA